MTALLVFPFNQYFIYCCATLTKNPRHLCYVVVCVELASICSINVHVGGTGHYFEDCRVDLDALEHLLDGAVR
jgi:hypothetical protein